MDPEYLIRLGQQRSQARLIRFDEQVVPAASLDDLDRELMDRFRTLQTQDDRETLLRKLGMASLDDGGSYGPPWPGSCSGRDTRSVGFHTPTSRPWPTGAGGARGDRRACLPDRRQGPLRSPGRASGERLPLRGEEHAGGGFEEHRPRRPAPVRPDGRLRGAGERRGASGFSMYGSKIRLRVFEDLLELYSPGALANTMTVESLPFRQASRNETVTSLLAKCPVPDEIGGLETGPTPLMDPRGEGVAIILERSERLSGGRPVDQTLDDSELRPTIFGASLVDPIPPESSTSP